MTVFDFEPEDAWDALDPPGVQIRNLARRLRLVDGRNDPPDDEPDDMLDALEARIASAAARRLTPRDRRRLEQAALDLIYVRSRV